MGVGINFFFSFSQVQYESIILIKIMPQAQEIWRGRVFRSGRRAGILIASLLLWSLPSLLSVEAGQFQPLARTRAPVASQEVEAQTRSGARDLGGNNSIPLRPPKCL